MMDSKCCGVTSPHGSSSVGGQLLNPRWFPGQLVSDRDLNEQAEYFLQLIRLHNRMLVGWGVVCGLLVCPVADESGNHKPWLVEIKPGLALSGWGDFIVVSVPFQVDLRSQQQDGPSGEPIDPRSDPWCTEVFRRRGEGPIYLGVRYWRVMTRPVRTPPLGCGCDEPRCEYSRWLDSFQVCFLDECPPSHQNPPSLDSLFEGSVLPCPPCPVEDCVVLAKINVDDSGVIQDIDNCRCRRNIGVRPHYWWQCNQDTGFLRIGRVQGASELMADGAEHTLVIDGVFRHMPENDTVHILTATGEERPTIREATFEPTTLTLKFDMPENETPGPRNLVIRDADGREVARKRDLLTILAAQGNRRAERGRNIDL